MKTAIGIFEDIKKTLRSEIKDLESLEHRNPNIEKELAEKRDQLLKVSHAVNRERTRIYFKPLVEKKEIADKFQESQKNKRGKRQTWNGKTKEQMQARDDAMISHYEELHAKRPAVYNPSTFAGKYAKEYGLKPTQCRTIISKHLDSLPG